MDGHVALLGGCLNHVYIRAYTYSHIKYHTASLNGIILYHDSDSRTEKSTWALLVLYVCTLKGVTAFRKLVQCLAEKKKTHAFLGQHFNVLKMVKLKQMFEFSLHLSQSKSEAEKSKG